MTVLETPFVPLEGTVVTALSLGTLHTHKHSKDAVLIDAVTEQTYKFPVNTLRRIIGSLKVLKDCDVHVQRHFDFNENASHYRPVDHAGFLFGHLEFDWEDLTKIDEALHS